MVFAVVRLALRFFSAISFSNHFVSLPCLLKVDDRRVRGAAVEGVLRGGEGEVEAEEETVGGSATAVVTEEKEREASEIQSWRAGSFW